MTGRIFDRLCAHYGKDAVFMDIDKIPAGIDFRQYLSNTLLKAEVVLAIVGHKWHGGARGGTDRILDENDPVRIEVETALYGGVPIIPVLIGHRKMPSAAQMPEKLKEFIYLNAVTVDPGLDFDHHMQRLIRAIDATLASKAKSADSARRRQDTGTHSRVDDRSGRLTTKERERIAARATEARSVPLPQVLDKPNASLLDRLSWLPPAMRLSFVAGAAVLCVALIVAGALLLGPSDQTTAASTRGPALSSVPASNGSTSRNDVVLPATRHYAPAPVVLPRQQ